MMSITKTTMHLVFGRLVEDGVIDLDSKVRDHLPEIGSGYSEATVRAVLDMDVAT